MSLLKTLILLSFSLIATISIATAQETNTLGKVSIKFVKNGQTVEEMSFFTLTKNYFSKVNNNSETKNISVELLPQSSASNMVIEEEIEILPTIVLDLETGATWNTFNEVAIPNRVDGTQFSASSPDAIASFRLYLSWIISKNHSLRLLYAPLQKGATITPTEELLFNGVSFMAGRPSDFSYKFNSYRLSYIYQFDPVGDFVFRLGFTGKIRDAAVGLDDGTRSTVNSNVGFVPLINFGVRYNITEKLFADIDADGSWAPQGSALDASIKLGYEINEFFDATIGYRFLGGGADVDTAYNFAAISTLFVGITMSL